MRAGELTPAHVCVDPHRPWLHEVDERRHLRVPQLADVEVALDAVDPFDLDPPEHDVARSLGQPLALDNPLAAVCELAAAEERLEHGRLRLLELQEQRIVVVTPEHEADESP